MVVIVKNLKRKVRQQVQAQTGERVENESKYHSKPVKVNGKKVADSRREYRRLEELRLQVKAGLIKDLQGQVKFPFFHNNILLGSYIADFVYHKKIGDRWDVTVEDAKGFHTQLYRFKKKCMWAFYNIVVQES